MAHDRQFLGFNIMNTGIVATLPQFGRLLMANVFGLLGDWIRRRRCMSLMNLRRLFAVLSSLLPGLLVCCIPLLAGSGAWAAVALLTASFGLNGGTVMTVMGNIHDLAPNFSSSILAVMNTVATTSGFIVPMVVTYFTEENVIMAMNYY